MIVVIGTKASFERTACLYFAARSCSRARPCVSLLSHASGWMAVFLLLGTTHSHAWHYMYPRRRRVPTSNEKQPKLNFATSAAEVVKPGI